MSDGATPGGDWDKIWHRITHDLKSHARHVREIGQWLEEDLAESVGPLPAQVVDCLGLLKRTGDELDAFAVGLAAYMTAGPAHGAPVDIASTVKAICAERPECRALEVELALEVETLPFAGTAQTVLLSALLSNVGHHAGVVHAQVRIATIQEPGWVVLRVEDNGCGIAPELYEKALAFGTSLAKDTSACHRGLGLATAQRLCTLHGGALRLGASSMPSGLAVEARLPAAEQP